MIELWSSAEWRAEATAWIDACLGPGVRTGPVAQPRVRAWGTVLTAPTAAGPVWFKATAPSTRYEVAVYAAFTEAGVVHVLRPLGLDADRGWLLLPDGGAPLDAPTGAGGDVDALAAVLAQYAQLQRAVAPQVPALLAAGVPDMRPVVLPQRFDEVVAAVAVRTVDAEDRALLRRVEGLRAEYADACAGLVAAVVAPSIDHNDLHPANVLVGAGGPWIYDWGDSAVAHPFASMLVPLGLQDDAAPAVRLRDAYLEPFTDLAPRADLVAELERACHVAKVARAATWLRALTAADDPRFARAPLLSLAALLDPSPTVSG